MDVTAELIERLVKRCNELEYRVADLERGRRRAEAQIANVVTPDMVSLKVAQLFSDALAKAARYMPELIEDR